MGKLANRPKIETEICDKKGAKSRKIFLFLGHLFIDLRIPQI